MRFRFQVTHFGLSRVSLLLGFTLVMGLLECGKKEEEAFKGPVTVEQAASVLAVGFIDWLGGKYNRCNSTSSSFRGHRI
jgi:hypothetical protein